MNYTWIHSSASTSAQVCFHNSCVFISRTNFSENEFYWCLYPYIAARNARELQASYLLANGTRSICFPIHFYTNACVLIFFMTFYDVKLQLLKAAVGANPSRISPNRTCQYSLLTLSYNINPSHFSLHTTFNILNIYM